MKNDVRNTKIKKLMINKKVQRCKSSSLGTKRKSEKKNEEKINNMKVINNDNENFDFNIKNELELADKIYKANQLKIEENKIEDDEINNLNEQIRKLMINNYELQQKIQNQLNLRITYERNQKEIASYINDLNYKFRNYDETVRNYESAMNKLRKENKKLTDEYDKKIERIEKENNKLKKRVEDRIELYLHQKGEIEEKTAKTRNLEKEIKDQEKLVKERIKINKAKAKELEEKYDDMYKKVINLEVNLEDQKLTNLLKRDLFIIEENDTKKIFDKNKNKDNKINPEVTDINNKIEDYENNNESLLYELRELNKKYENLIFDKRKSIKSGKHTYSFQSTTNRSNRTTTGDLNFSINKEIQGTQTSKYK